MMQLSRIALLVLLAPLLQVTIVEGIDFFGASPDLVVIVCVSIGLIAGSVVGAIGGFTMGLLLGMFSSVLLGPHAMVATVIGYWSGRWGEQLVTDRHPLPPIVACVCSTLVMQIGRPLIDFLVSPQAGPMGSVWSQAFIVTLLNIVLVLPVYVAVRRFVGHVPDESAAIEAVAR
jgi:rod shape-determining protein MreD